MALGFYFMKINKNKNKIIIVLILALISLGIFCYSKTLEKEIENEVKLELREYFEVPIVAKLKETSKEVEDSDIVKQRETVSIVVLDKTYQIEIKENETAYLAMKRLEEIGNGFSFGGKNYPSLGFFVDEINGVKNRLGAYWIYYVNDHQAPVGISEYKIKDGDIINWKLE